MHRDDHDGQPGGHVGAAGSRAPADRAGALATDAGNDDAVIEVGEPARESASGGSSGPGAYHPGPDTHLHALRRDLERIGVEAVSWADAASDALLREARLEAAHIRAEAVRRADRLVREVEQARMALRSEARMAAARIWESARNPDASLARTMRDGDAALALPPISWHEEGPVGAKGNGNGASNGQAAPVNGAAAPILDPALDRALDPFVEAWPTAPDPLAPAPAAPAGTSVPTQSPAPVASAAPPGVPEASVAPAVAAGAPAPAAAPAPQAATEVPEVLAAPVAPPDAPAVPPAPGDAPPLEVVPLTPPSSATAPQSRATLTRVLVGCVVVVALVVAAWLVVRSSDDGRSTRLVPTSAPATTTPGAADVNTADLASHFANDLTALAPTGQGLADRGPITDAGDAPTREFEQLATSLARDRASGVQATYTAQRGGAENAQASMAVYTSPDAAARAYDAAHAFYLGEGRTAAGNTQIELPSNLALRSFAFEQGRGANRVATAFLQFPGGIVQLTTNGLPSDALVSMVAVVTGWAS